MMYRGFKIERFVPDTDSPTPDDSPGRFGTESVDPPYVQYRVSETVAGYYWQEIGTTNDLIEAKEMVDRIATVRNNLARVMNESFEGSETTSC